MNNPPEPRRGCLRALPGFTRVEADLFAEETNGAKVTGTHSRPGAPARKWAAPASGAPGSEADGACLRVRPDRTLRYIPRSVCPRQEHWGPFSEAQREAQRLLLLVGRGAGWCGQQGCKATSGQLNWSNPSMAGPESPWTRGAPSQVGTDTWTHLRLRPGWPCPSLSSPAQPSQARPHWVPAQRNWAQTAEPGPLSEGVTSEVGVVWAQPQAASAPASLHLSVISCLGCVARWLSEHCVLGTYVYVCVNACVFCWRVCLGMLSLENENIIDFVVKFGWSKSSDP